MFAQDKFCCSFCNKELFTIHDYIEHMLLFENCVLILEQSTVMEDLKLPRFRKSCLSNEKTESQLEKNTNDKWGIRIETGFGIKWKCRMCSITFSRYAALFNHCKLQHVNLPEKTDLIALSNDVIKSEDMKQTSDSPEELPIALERESYQKPPEFLQAKLTNIKKQELPTCIICGQIFKSVRIVTSHIAIVHSKNRPFVCQMDECNITFKTKGSLVRHQRRHTGVRPFGCLQCGRKFRESGSLLRHQQSRRACTRKDEKYFSRYGITLPFNVDNKFDCKLQIQEQLKKEQTSSTKQEVQKVCSNNSLEDTKSSVMLQIYRNESIPGPSIEKTPIIIPVNNEKKLLPNLINMKKETFSYESTVNEQVSQLESLENSLEVNIIRTSFNCPLCEKSYKRESLLSSHIKCHLDADNVEQEDTNDNPDVGSDIVDEPMSSWTNEHRSEETLSEINDYFSETESEMIDIRSLYSEPSDAFDHDEFLPLNESLPFCI